LAEPSGVAERQSVGSLLRLLQMSIAEQLASPDSTADLKEIQSHTESGHGLWTISAHGKDFPASYMVACRNRGHFYEYCRFRGIDLTPYVSKARPNSWDDLSTEQRDRLISLADLLRRIPELQSLIEETLDTEPMSFRVAYATRNHIVQSERMQEHAQKTGQVLLNPPIAGPSTVTYIGIYPHGQRLTAEYLNSLLTCRSRTSDQRKIRLQRLRISLEILPIRVTSIGINAFRLINLAIAAQASSFHSGGTSPTRLSYIS
jgi:hypothetical protein